MSLFFKVTLKFSCSPGGQKRWQKKILYRFWMLITSLGDQIGHYQSWQYVSCTWASGILHNLRCKEYVLANSTQGSRLRENAVCFHGGLYEYSVMPFGLANALGIFWGLMFIVLLNMKEFAMAHLNDIMIISTLEHINYIQPVFAFWRKHDLKLTYQT